MDFEAAKVLCRSFAGCTEDIKWGADLVFSVGEKMFAVTGSATPAGGISFKVEDDRFLELTDRPRIIPAPYLAAPSGCTSTRTRIYRTRKRRNCCADPTSWYSPS